MTTPAVSPRGFGAGSNLFVLPPDGSRRQLTRRGGTDPSWSPRGRWIAFTRAGQVWVVRSRGGRPEQLTKKGGEYLWVLDRRGGPARRLGDEPVEPVGYGPSGFLASPPEWQPLPR